MGLIFFILDTIAFLLILLISLVLRRLGDVNTAFYLANMAAFLPVFLITSFMLWVLDFYDTKNIRHGGIPYKYLLTAFLISLALSVGFLYFIIPFFSLLSPKTILLIVFVLYAIYIALSRKYYHRIHFAENNVIVFGKSKTIDAILEELHKSNAYNIIAYEETIDKTKRYPTKDLDLVIVDHALFSRDPDAWPFIAKNFISKGITLDTDFNVYENLLGRISRESVDDGMWVMRGIGVQRKSRVYDLTKRFMDLFFACLLLPFALPLGLVLYCLIRFIDGYPPFFIQKRVGYLEKPIRLYKFRTIRPGGTTRHITKTGKILRRFRLDELPQLINVLNGDLSFVGPRAIWIKEHNLLAQHIANHQIRTVVKPGITGWAQLNFKAPPTYHNLKRDNGQAAQIAEDFDAGFMRFSYDVWYIKNASALLDLAILIKTARRVFIKYKNEV
ncbi:MAG: sugar transferase [Elusimicrobiota bacterium]|jgi:lipopolysaccharide/colanic/teichoic acid biosynthesis glycosyltransferase|nr:sugar transferase [Elusimicrobiota bacterium]